jgi:Fe-S cluster assembly iron-binding protein IscA
MLQLTTEAARHLISLRRERGVGEDAGARFVGRGGRVGVTFAPGPVAGDHVVEAPSIKVFVAADIAEAMDQSTIDAQDENGITGLVIRKRGAARTKAKRTAG